MSVELITGRSGRDHISSNHARMLNAGIYGADHYLLKQLSWDTPPSMQDANTVIIPPRVLMMNGAQVVIDQAETVTIQSGSQGQKRSDIIVCRYSLDTSTGYETATLQAIKGTPAGGTPEDPAIETDSIIGGAIVHDMPICRINLDGITITGVNDLEQVLNPVGDSLTLDGGQYVQGSIFKQNDPVRLTRLSGGLWWISGSVNVAINTWNPQANDRILTNLPFRANGTQTVSVSATNNLTVRLTIGGGYRNMTAIAEGLIKDWPRDTMIPFGVGIIGTATA